MPERYIEHHDPGDENDYWARKAAALASKEYTGKDEPPTHEQIIIALRVMAEAYHHPEDTA